MGVIPGDPGEPGGEGSTWSPRVKPSLNNYGQGRCSGWGG